MKRPTIELFLLSAWLYFGGPMVWGAWMVWRLGIYGQEEFALRLWPTGLAILAVFFLAHCLNLLRLTSASPDKRPALHGRTTRNFFILISTFATVGTLAFLVLPAWLSRPGAGDMDAGSIRKACIGALAGASLIGLFYPFFFTRTLSLLPGYFNTRKLVMKLNLVLYVSGLTAYASVAIWTLRPSALAWGGILGLLLPLTMSVVLQWRTARLVREAGGPRHDEG